jgi:hypothetical protein
LAEVARALAATGNTAQAREVAPQARNVALAITDDRARSEALTEVVNALAAAGDLSAAASLIGVGWLMEGHPLGSWNCLLSINPNAALNLSKHLRNPQT